MIASPQHHLTASLFTVLMEIGNSFDRKFHVHFFNITTDVTLYIFMRINITLGILSSYYLSCHLGLLPIDISLPLNTINHPKTDIPDL